MLAVAARSAADDLLEPLEADVPLVVESDVGAAQLLRGLRAAGLAMRFDPAKGIIVSRARGQRSLN